MLDALGWQVVLGYSFFTGILSLVVLSSSCHFCLFCVGYVKSFLYSMGDVLHGKHFGVGACYVDTSIPIYIGEIMRTPTQNLSYII